MTRSGALRDTERRGPPQGSTAPARLTNGTLHATVEWYESRQISRDPPTHYVTAPSPSTRPSRAIPTRAQETHRMTRKFTALAVGLALTLAASAWADAPQINGIGPYGV